MDIPNNITELGGSKYEAKVYLALVDHNHLNGSQIRNIFGVPRADIYDTLKSLISKGSALKIEKGKYVVAPPGEVAKRLGTKHKKRHRHFQKKRLAGIKGQDHLVSIPMACLCIQTL